MTLGAEGANHLEDARKVYQAVEAEYEPVRLIKEGICWRGYRSRAAR